jgi:hypothetical protein
MALDADKPSPNTRSKPTHNSFVFVISFFLSFSFFVGQAHLGSPTPFD